MTMRLTNAHWEALSAYLDGQLNPAERDHIEQQLKSDEELRAGFDDLRRTRALLRSRPRIRAPRNFTLTPAMVGVDRRRTSSRTWFQGFSFSSALATFALLVIIAGDLLGLGTRQVNMALEAAPEAVQIEVITEVVEAPVAEAAEPMAEAESTVLVETEAPLLAAKAAGDATPIPEELLMLSAPYPPPGAGDLSALAPAATPVDVFETAPTPTPGVDLVLVPPGAEDSARAAAGELEQAPAESKAISEQSEVLDQSVPMNTAVAASRLSSIQLVEIGLAVLALVTSLAAFIFWRRSRA